MNWMGGSRLRVKKQHETPESKQRSFFDKNRRMDNKFAKSSGSDADGSMDVLALRTPISTNTAKRKSPSTTSLESNQDSKKALVASLFKKRVLEFPNDSSDKCKASTSSFWQRPEMKVPAVRSGANRFGI